MIEIRFWPTDWTMFTFRMLLYVTIAITVVGFIALDQGVTFGHP